MAGLGILCLVGACHLVVGDFELGEDGGGAGSGGSGIGETGGQANGGCASDTVQCVGNVLQRCNSEGSGWDNAAVCASEALCDAVQGTCLAPDCAIGEWRCQDAELQTCNGTRDGWLTILSCPSAGHCSAGSGTCAAVPCEAGELQCSSAVLQRCREDRSGWDDVDTCASAALCDAVDGGCREMTCGLGEFRCDGAQLQTCAATQDGWTTVESCHSEALCHASSGECGVEACTNPGTFRCSDTGALERCAEDLTSWLAVDVCRSAAHCDAVNGACRDAPCTPGEYQCNGATLEMCNEERTGWDEIETCETDGLCQLTLSQGSTVCEVPLCAAGEFRCEGAQPLVCNASRTGFRENGGACVTAELCAQGTCSPPTCDPGDTRCTNTQPEICNPGRTGYVPNGDACASAALCNPTSGTCGDAVCIQDQMRCDPANPTRLQRCATTLRGWDPCDTCATNELCSASVGASSACDESSCQEPTCSLGERWCGGSEGSTLYACPTSLIRAQAQVVDTCATAGLCELTLSDDLTTCVEPSCEVWHQWCGGSENRTLYKCPDSRINSEPIVLDTCATAGLCAAAHAEYSDTCPAPTCALTDTWCGGDDNRTFYQCPPSRINSEAIALDTCATSALCQIAHSEDRTSCPPPACGVGETVCGSTGNRTLQMCNSDRTAFATCDTCDSSALCTASLGTTSCNTSACHACLVDEKLCNGSELEICNAAGTGWTSLDCGSAALCQQSLSPAAQATCDVCLVDSQRCSDAQPQTCEKSDGPAAWVDSGAECDSVDLCDGVSGTCVCTLTETRCDSATGVFATCELTGWSETACEAGCDDAGCLPVEP